MFHLIRKSKFLSPWRHLDIQLLPASISEEVSGKLLVFTEYVRYAKKGNKTTSKLYLKAIFIWIIII